MKYILVKLIELYQRTLSPDHGWFRSRHPFGYCKYQPTCSNYCKLAILKHGSFKGSFLCFWRVLRCNPWSKGGVDEI